MTVESGNMKQGHVTTQAVSHWLLTVVAWIQSKVRSCRMCGGQWGTWAGLLKLPLPTVIPQSSSFPLCLLCLMWLMNGLLMA